MDIPFKKLRFYQRDSEWCQRLLEVRMLKTLFTSFNSPFSTWMAMLLSSVRSGWSQRMIILDKWKSLKLYQVYETCIKSLWSSSTYKNRISFLNRKEDGNRAQYSNTWKKTDILTWSHGTVWVDPGPTLHLFPKSACIKTGSWLCWVYNICLERNLKRPCGQLSK